LNISNIQEEARDEAYIDKVGNRRGSIAEDRESHQGFSSAADLPEYEADQTDSADY
jgi:hypothetical protein